MNQDNRQCKYENCSKEARSGQYCNFHGTKCTISSFLCKKYSNMKQRVDGKFAHTMKRSTKYVGLLIIARDDFYTWSRDDSTFLDLYEKWVQSGFDLKLTPVVDRLRSEEGYVVGNMRWVTNSYNCGITAVVRKLNKEKLLSAPQENSCG